MFLFGAKGGELMIYILNSFTTGLSLLAFFVSVWVWVHLHVCWDGMNGVCFLFISEREVGGGKL